MSAPARAPACCGGLRQALLHDWEHGFPLHESPFQLVARQLGAGLREVLNHCHALQEEGALEAIRLSWGAPLYAVRWRVTQRLPTPAAAARPLDALRALGGVSEAFVAETLPSRTVAEAPSWLWFDLFAHRVGQAKAQHDAFRAAAGPAEASTISSEAFAPAADPCACAEPPRCAEPECPCEDVALAARCEQPLPLVTHPYRQMAHELERSERELIAKLRRWQRSGYLASAGLARPLETTASTALMALLPRHAAHDGALPARLLARVGIAAVEPICLGALGEAWLVAASGTPAQALPTLERALAAAAPGGTHQLLQVKRLRLRHAPALFGAGTA